MNLNSISDSFFFLWILLPLLIFFARICDVTLQTLRIVFVSKGLKHLAPLVGFFEVTIWLLAIRAVLGNLNNFVCFFAYGAGFAAGSYIGIIVEQKLAIGRAVLRIVTQKDASQLIDHLRSKGYGLTHIDALGHKGTVKIIYLIIKKTAVPELTLEIKRFNPRAFYTLEDVQFVSEGPSTMKSSRLLTGSPNQRLRFWRKGK
jgi:uncharacterized protein YebE (UPF0316 family)